MKGEYNTKQKDVIIEFLKSNSDKHLTASDIAEHISSSGQKVGLTTVYRCLEKLCASGKVRKYMIDKNSACFRYEENGGDGCGEHFHLKCVECGALIHVDCSFMREMGEHIKEHHGFTINNSQTVLYGRCGKCSGLSAEPDEHDDGDSCCGCKKHKTERKNDN